MYLIVGLGNPGTKYERTRHNVGFITIDLLSAKFKIPVTKLKFKALIGEGRIGGERVVLMKPQTFMNLSGEAVRAAVQFYKIEHSRLIVIYDDIDLEAGRLRIRKQGSSGTHNGMRNIIYLLGYDDFPRFRIGVSKPLPQQDLANFVLSKFRDEEIKPVGSAIDNAVLAAELMIREGIDKAMNQYNL